MTDQIHVEKYGAEQNILALGNHKQRAVRHDGIDTNLKTGH